VIDIPPRNAGFERGTAKLHRLFTTPPTDWGNLRFRDFGCIELSLNHRSEPMAKHHGAAVMLDHTSRRILRFRDVRNIESGWNDLRAMPNRSAQGLRPDHTHCGAICDEIGERLRDVFKPDVSESPLRSGGRLPPDAARPQ
jgi:hypothetical protein